MTKHSAAHVEALGGALVLNHGPGPIAFTESALHHHLIQTSQLTHNPPIAPRLDWDNGISGEVGLGDRPEHGGRIGFLVECRAKCQEEATGA
jgi:hypothetical protein